jgi:hypothetical protein
MVQERSSLLTESPLADAVRRYYAELGYTEIEPPEGVDVAFRKGEHRIGVRLVKFSRSSVRDRRFIRSEIYRLLRDRPCEELYIAVEEISFGRLPPPYEFRESGIGLLRVSGSSVEVAIPATPLKKVVATSTRHTLQEGGSSRSVGDEYLEVDQLVKVVKELKELIEEVKKRSDALAASSDRKSDANVSATALEDVVHSEAKENEKNIDYVLAVDFIKGNPWLGIIGGFGAKKEGD